jgi:hypothetical protein
LNMFRGVSTVLTLNVTSKLPPSLYLMTVPRLSDGTVCKNRDKPIKYTVRVSNRDDLGLFSINTGRLIFTFFIRTESTN